MSQNEALAKASGMAARLRVMASANETPVTSLYEVRAPVCDALCEQSAGVAREQEQGGSWGSPCGGRMQAACAALRGPLLHHVCAAFAGHGHARTYAPLARHSSDDALSGSMTSQAVSAPSVFFQHCATPC